MHKREGEKAPGGNVSVTGGQAFETHLKEVQRQGPDGLGYCCHEEEALTCLKPGSCPIVSFLNDDRSMICFSRDDFSMPN